MLDIPLGSAVPSITATIRQLTLGRPRIPGLHARLKPDIQDCLLRSQRAGKTDSGQSAAITRDVFHARLACPSQAIRGINQAMYRNHSISTTQSHDGMWVAAFGRLDGEMMEMESRSYAVMETPPHEAETIAIADAQIQIDERVSGIRGAANSRL